MVKLSLSVGGSKGFEAGTQQRRGSVELGRRQITLENLTVELALHRGERQVTSRNLAQAVHQEVTLGPA